MPARAQIQEEIQSIKATAQDSIRRRYLANLSEYTGHDTILYMSGFTSMKAPIIPPPFQSISTQDLQGFMAALHDLKGKKLDLILHSPGGSLEAADQIVQYLRSKYDYIRAVVPQNAMSAATMIACACDEIVMGKHSAIGPIDPQLTLPGPHGQFTAPAQAILNDFETAKESISKDQKTAVLWVNRINMLPPGILNICSETIANSKLKVSEWLNKYMFKNDEDKKGEDIAEWLGNPKNHKTHGRPIGLELCKTNGLKVVQLESDQNLQEKVLSVFHASAVTLDITGCVKFIENQNGKGWFISLEPMMGPPVAPNKSLQPTP